MLAQTLTRILREDVHVQTLLDAKVCEVKDLLSRVTFVTLNIVADSGVDIFKVLYKLVPTNLPEQVTQYGKLLNYPIRLKFRSKPIQKETSNVYNDIWSTSERIVYSDPAPFNIDIVLLPHLRHAVPDNFGASVRDIDQLIQNYTLDRNAYTMFVFSDEVEWSYQPIVSWIHTYRVPCQGVAFTSDLDNFKPAKEVSLHLDLGTTALNLKLNWTAMPELKTYLRTTLPNENSRIELANIPWFKVPVMHDSETTLQFYENLRKAVHKFHREVHPDNACQHDVDKFIDKVFDDRKDDFQALASGVLQDSSALTVPDDYYRFIWPSVRHGMLIGFAQATVLNHFHNDVNVSASVQFAIDALCATPQQNKNL